MNKTNEETGKCPHYTDNRACGVCEHASELGLFDPCCLYPEKPRRKEEQKRFT